MSPQVLVWALAAVLLAVGLVGSVVPGLPGAPLIFAAGVVLEVFLPSYLSGWTLLAVGLLAALSAGADLALTAAGGKRFGATAWGALGAAAGAVAGLLAGPAGLFVGAFAGAVLAELALAKRAPEAALKAGLGAWLGLLASTVAKAALAAAMTALLIIDCFVLS